jgi:hypothetical protein
VARSSTREKEDDALSSVSKEEDDARSSTREEEDDVLSYASEKYDVALFSISEKEDDALSISEEDDALSSSSVEKDDAQSSVSADEDEYDVMSSKSVEEDDAQSSNSVVEDDVQSSVSTDEDDVMSNRKTERDQRDFHPAVNSRADRDEFHPTKKSTGRDDYLCPRIDSNLSWDSSDEVDAVQELSFERNANWSLTSPEHAGDADINIVNLQPYCKKIWNLQSEDSKSKDTCGRRTLTNFRENGTSVLEKAGEAARKKRKRKRKRNRNMNEAVAAKCGTGSKVKESQNSLIRKRRLSEEEPSELRREPMIKRFRADVSCPRRDHIVSKEKSDMYRGLPTDSKITALKRQLDNKKKPLSKEPIIEKDRSQFKKADRSKVIIEQDQSGLAAVKTHLMVSKAQKIHDNPDIQKAESIEIREKEPSQLFLAKFDCAKLRKMAKKSALAPSVPTCDPGMLTDMTREQLTAMRDELVLKKIGLVRQHLVQKEVQVLVDLVQVDDNLNKVRWALQIQEYVEQQQAGAGR